MEERVLHHLHLLGTEGLLSQFIFDGLQLTDVSAHTEILLQLSLVVVEGDEVELQVQGFAFSSEGGPHVELHTGVGLVVHVVQDTLCRSFPLRIDEVQHPGLCQ